jgi:hypothetical protein
VTKETRTKEKETLCCVLCCARALGKSPWRRARWTTTRRACD